MTLWDAFAALGRMFAVVAAIKAAGGKGQIRTMIRASADGQDLGEFPFVTITI